jgi:hypothetical protein
MKLGVGDLFVVKTTNQEHITILVLEQEEPLPLYKQHYKVLIHYPDGNIKKQSLDADAIQHYVTTKQFIHYPVIK